MKVRELPLTPVGLQGETWLIEKGRAELLFYYLRLIILFRYQYCTDCYCGHDGERSPPLTPIDDCG